VSGVRRVQNPAVLESITVKSRQILERRATALATEIIGLLDRSAVGNSGLPDAPNNPPSLPGEPPAQQSKRLKNSIQARKRNEDVWEVGPAKESYENVKAGSDGDKYPVYMEFGTRKGKIKARPYMRPSVATFKAKFR
jgi:hypothetical protein